MYKVIRETSELREYIGSTKFIAFDIETSPDEAWRDDGKASLDAHKSHIAGISFSVGEGSGVYCPLTHRVGKNIEDAVDFWQYLKTLFTDRNLIKVAHNLTFEAMFFYARGIVIQPPVYDTIAAAQLTLKNNTGFRKLSDSGLKSLAPGLLDAELPSFSKVTAGRHFDELNPQDAETIRYACADSDYTLRLYNLFNGWFDRWMPKHRYIAEQIESPTAVYCGLMKYNGILADKPLMERKTADCQELNMLYLI